MSPSLSINITISSLFIGQVCSHTIVHLSLFYNSRDSSSSSGYLNLCRTFPRMLNRSEYTVDPSLAACVTSLFNPTEHQAPSSGRPRDLLYACHVSALIKQLLDQKLRFCVVAFLSFSQVQGVNCKRVCPLLLLIIIWCCSLLPNK